MSARCCQNTPRFDGLSAGFKRVLWAVIAINATMFVVEVAAGALAGSQALWADALDFLGDTMTYGITLLVLGRPQRVRSAAALFKGLTMAVMGLWVFGTTAYQTLILGVPQAEVMGAVAMLALAANLGCLLLLLRYREGDANVRSVWLCSRNDVIGNVGVMLAAGAVWLTSSAWPDLIVAGLMAGLFLWSALQITRQALQEWRQSAVSFEAAE